MTTLRIHPVRNLAAWAALAACAGGAFAGRPLLVDDANVNERGAGHVEAWQERLAGGGTAWNVAPAYAPWEAVELSVGLARSARWAQDSRRLQAKVRLAEPRDQGCHPALSGGAVAAEGSEARFLTAIMSCSIARGQLHVNLGASRSRDAGTLGGYGAAWEQPLPAGATGHVEWVGQRGSPAIRAVGLRRDLVRGVQLDGSIGRSNGRTLFSIGLKGQF